MKRILVLVGFATLATFGFGIAFMLSTSGEYYRTYSPDKQYSVYASKYNWAYFSFSMPGGGGDASGKVFLYDEVTKRTLYSAPIAMLWMVDGIKWTDSTAYFVGETHPNVLDPWKLPRPILVQPID